MKEIREIFEDLLVELDNYEEHSDEWEEINENLTQMKDAIKDQENAINGYLEMIDDDYMNAVETVLHGELYEIDDIEDYATEFISNTYDVKWDDNLFYYIDLEKFVKDLLIDDYTIFDTNYGYIYYPY